MKRDFASSELVGVAADAGVESLALTLVRGAGIVLAGSALIAVCAHVSIPLLFTPVPVTLQPFAVVLLGLLLSPRLAVSTMVAYLLEGAAGLPVFTPHGLGGVAQLLGPTGGYLLSYPLVAGLVSALWRSGMRSLLAGFDGGGTGEFDYAGARCGLAGIDHAFRGGNGFESCGAAVFAGGCVEGGCGGGDCRRCCEDRWQSI